MIKIAPSLLAADFTRMQEAVENVKRWGGDLVHCDVMDGKFVPNISFGQKMIADLRKKTDLPLDVHLMIVEPERYVEEFAKAGADYITVHQEASVHLDRTLSLIRSCGCKSAVALNPSTPPETLEYVLDKVDMILVMSVNPGYGGQKFIPTAIDKIRRLKEMIGDRPISIEVDGGVNAQNAPLLAEAGAEIFVAGSSVFGAQDPAEAIRLMKGI